MDQRHSPPGAPARRTQRGLEAKGIGLPWRQRRRVRRQFGKSGDAFVCGRMGTQPGRLGIAPAGQQPAAPTAADLLDLGERGGKPRRIAGEPCRSEIGVELACARQAELRKERELRRDGQRQQPPQIDFEYARKYEGQHHEQYQLSRHRQQVRQAADVVGQAHHPEVVVRDMRYLVSKHPGQLARRERTQQAVGKRDGGAPRRTDGKGIDHATGHVMERRHGQQFSAPCKFMQQAVNRRRLAGAERPRAIEPQGHGSGGSRLDGKRQHTCEEREPQAGLAQQQTAGQSAQPQEGQNQERRLQPIGKAVPMPAG